MEISWEPVLRGGMRGLKMKKPRILLEEAGLSVQCWDENYACASGPVVPVEVRVLCAENEARVFIGREV